MSRLLPLIGLCGAFVVSLLSPAAAQEDGVVKLVVPFAPGGFPDTIGRLVASQVSKELRQTFIVENRPGGAGVIAAELVARAAPDGRTLLVADAQQWAIAPAMLKNLKYNPETDSRPSRSSGRRGISWWSAPTSGSGFPGVAVADQGQSRQVLLWDAGGRHDPSPHLRGAQEPDGTEADAGSLSRRAR